MKPKKVPMRLCMGCNENKTKKELIRVVKNQLGEISLDSIGKKAGRGAYICPNIDCFKKARKAKRFEKAFECSIPDEVYNILESELEKK